MGHHIVDHNAAMGDTPVPDRKIVEAPAYTSSDRIAVPSITVERLRGCIQARKDGTAARDQIRDAIAPICEEARRSQVMPEELLISLKQLCNSLPEFGTLRSAEDRGAFLDTVVTLAIEEYYRT